MVLGVLYAGMIVALPAGGFSQPEEGTRWLQADSLWRHAWRTLSIDPPGGDLDPDGEFAPDPFVRTVAGLRPPFPVGFPLLASLPWALIGPRGAWLIPAAAAILCVSAGARLARTVVPEGWSAPAGIVIVAATPLVLHGAMLREETLGALLAIAALIAVLSGRALLSGLLMGLAAAICSSCAPLIPAVVIAGMVAWGARDFTRRSLALVAGAGAVMAPWAINHRLVFGSWLATGEGGSAALTAAAVLAALLVLAMEMLPGLRPDPRRRFLVWGASLWIAGASVLPGGGQGSGWVPASLAPASGALILALVASAHARWFLPGGRALAALVGVAVGLGLAAQGVGLRRMAGERTYNAAVLERVREGVPQGGVILSDLPGMASLLATLRPTMPALYVRRGTDLDSLSARIEAAGRSTAWVVRERSRQREGNGPAATKAGERFAREEQLELGGGLVLVRFEHEAGVRGFMMTPRGD
jgi:hypothetical protein